MAGMTWGQAIAGGVDRGVDTAMQARRMKLYEGREGREQEEFERAERDKQELDEAMAVAMENQQKGQGNTLEPPKRKVMGPDGQEIEKEINPATWAKAVVATRSLDKSITDDINATIFKARQKGLAAAKMRGLGGLGKLAEVYGEVTGEKPTIKPDPKTGKIQVLGQDGSLWREYDSPDQAYEETMMLLEPDKIANYVINRKAEEAKSAREVKTHEAKKQIDQKYKDPEIYESEETEVTPEGAQYNRKRFFTAMGKEMVEMPQKTVEDKQTVSPWDNKEWKRKYLNQDYKK